MTEYLILKFLHLLAFVYWLGGDLGTFFASRFVIRDDLSEETRATALKIMLGCDQGPKTCMPLMFPLGLQMSQLSGLSNLPPLAMGLVWLLALIWSANVQYLYFGVNTEAREKITRFDFYLRVAVIVGVVAYAGGGLVTGRWIGADWLAWKMLIFAGLVACGLVIRVKLRPFVVAFGRLVAEGASADINRALAVTLGRVRPFVYLIWFGLLLNAGLGLHLI